MFLDFTQQRDEPWVIAERIHVAVLLKPVGIQGFGTCAFETVDGLLNHP